MSDTGEGLDTFLAERHLAVADLLDEMAFRDAVRACHGAVTAADVDRVFARYSRFRSGEPD
jgi:hypothetical protein